MKEDHKKKSAKISGQEAKLAIVLSVSVFNPFNLSIYSRFCSKTKQRDEV